MFRLLVDAFFFVFDQHTSKKSKGRVRALLRGARAYEFA